MNRIPVSIIIVSFNTKALLRNCLQSIYEQTQNLEFEVIVSDNGSKDGSVEMVRNEFPQVYLVENKENLGFGKGNNRGLDVAKGKCVFYLNSDTLLLNNAVKIFFDCWTKLPENVGAIGCNLVDADGKPTESYGSFPQSKKMVKAMFRHMIAFYVKNVMKFFHKDISKLRPVPVYKQRFGEVDYVTGADLFMTNDENARYDESFFLYFEETDMQWRLRKKGKVSMIVEGPKIQHLIRGGGKRVDDVIRYGSFSIIQSEISRVRYAKKNLSPMAAFLLKIMISGQWLSPYIFKNTRKFYKVLWGI